MLLKSSQRSVANKTIALLNSTDFCSTNISNAGVGADYAVDSAIVAKVAWPEQARYSEGAVLFPS